MKSYVATLWIPVDSKLNGIITQPTTIPNVTIVVTNVMSLISSSLPLGANDKPMATSVGKKTVRLINQILSIVQLTALAGECVIPKETCHNERGYRTSRDEHDVLPKSPGLNTA